MVEVTSSLQAFKYLRNFENPYAEELWILALDSQLRLLHGEMLFRGTVDRCLIHPRDIFRVLILKNAHSFVMAHNHPSQDVTPSEQDLILTRKIHSAAQLFQIGLNDHIIFSKEKYFSMADQGFLKGLKKGRSLLLNSST